MGGEMVSILRCVAVLAVLSVAHAEKWPLRAAHKDAVPPSFDCAMRKAAYSFGKKLIPRQGTFESLFYALDLNADDCKGELDSSSPAPTRIIDENPIPLGAIYVSPDGKDAPDAGSVSSPFRSLQAAVDAAVTREGPKHVVLRHGEHFLTETLT